MAFGMVRLVSLDTQFGCWRSLGAPSMKPDEAGFRLINKSREIKSAPRCSTRSPNLKVD